MKDIKKIKIAYILSGSVFWLPVIMLYFQSLKLSNDQVYSLLSIYSIMIVLFEYPTGVIGDHYSHKVSMALGYLSIAISMVLCTIHGGMVYYIFVLALLAFGTTLKTGSDISLIYGFTKDFKKDFANLIFLEMVWAFIASAVGGFLGSISLVLPMYVTAGFFLIGSILLFSVRRHKNSETNMEGNIFNTAGKALRYVKSSRKVVFFLLIGGLIGAFFNDMKWFYTPLFQGLDFNVGLYGILTSVGMLMFFVGNRIYTKYSSSKIPPFILAVSFSLLLISLLTPFAAMFGFVLIHIMNGYLNIILDVEINKSIDDKYRASILSLKSLLIRLFSSVYLFLWGLMIDNLGLKIFFLINAVGIFVIGLLSIFGKSLKGQNRVSVD